MWQSTDQQVFEANRKDIRVASNKKILRRQLELLAEYSRVSYGQKQIPACSREMAQIYRELVNAETRSILFPVCLLGVGFSILYGLGVKLIKLTNRQ